MYHTERKYFACGLERRYRFWAYALTIGKLGIMVCQPFRHVSILNFYILDK
jgi:hypothetical protein